MPEAYYIIKEFLRRRFPAGHDVVLQGGDFRCFGRIRIDDFHSRMFYVFTIRRQDVMGRDVHALIELLETEMAIWSVAEAGRC